MKKYTLKVKEQNNLFDLIITLTEHLDINELNFKKIFDSVFKVEFVTCLQFQKTRDILKEYLVWDFGNCINSLTEIPIDESHSKSCSILERMNEEYFKDIDDKISKIQNQHYLLTTNKNSTPKKVNELSEIYPEQLLDLQKEEKLITNEIQVFKLKLTNQLK